MLPIYLSSPAFNFVAMSSYDHFCFLQHIRTLAFPSVNPNTILPSAEGSLCDALAEMCFFYAQNLPMIVMLLLHAGLALALLLLFFSPERLPGGLSLSDIDQSIVRHDRTFFDKSTSALTHYTKGVLIANAAWAAWRVLVLLLSWYVCLTCSKKYMPNEYHRRVGLWIFSGYGCAGLCGPCSCKEEEEISCTVSIHSEKLESGLGPAMGTSGVDALPWSWKECTLLHMYKAYKFCLTLHTTHQEVSGESPWWWFQRYREGLCCGWPWRCSSATPAGSQGQTLAGSLQEPRKVRSGLGKKSPNVPCADKLPQDRSNCFIPVLPLPQNAPVWALPQIGPHSLHDLVWCRSRIA